jgi:putative transposase
LVAFARVWNDALALSKASKYPGYNSLAKTLTLSKKTEERQWLNDVSSVPLQQSLKQLEAAYKNYFDFLKGKRKGRKVGQPKFKKKFRFSILTSLPQTVTTAIDIIGHT